MSIPPLDYEAAYKMALQQNIDIFYRDMSGKDFALKIANFAEKYDKTPLFIRRKIMDDPIFALTFVKDPGRQSIHQTLAAQYITGFSKYPEFADLKFTMLPAGGSAACYINKQGQISHYNEAVDPLIKSIDFKWTWNNIMFYAAHKYTKDEGGAQDNQYHDLRLFLQYAKLNSNPSIMFYAIADGQYYQRQDRLYHMNNDVDFKGPRCKAITINELANDLLKK
jgi:hypothetical protein